MVVVNRYAQVGGFYVSIVLFNTCDGANGVVFYCYLCWLAAGEPGVLYRVFLGGFRNVMDFVFVNGFSVLAIFCAVIVGLIACQVSIIGAALAMAALVHTVIVNLFPLNGFVLQR